MLYSQLSPTYKYGVLASAISSRETEYFHYEFDRNNFEQLLKTCENKDERKDLEKRIADITFQMNKVERLIDVLKLQIDDEKAYNLAVVQNNNKTKTPSK
jgi:hypothetical protein